MLDTAESVKNSLIVVCGDLLGTVYDARNNPKQAIFIGNPNLDLYKIDGILCVINPVSEGKPTNLQGCKLELFDWVITFTQYSKNPTKEKSIAACWHRIKLHKYFRNMSSNYQPPNPRLGSSEQLIINLGHSGLWMQEQTA